MKLTIEYDENGKVFKLYKDDKILLISRVSSRIADEVEDQLLKIIHTADNSEGEK